MWQAATIREVVPETPTARTIVLDLPDWPGHLAGQHLDIRLTAEDGYTAVRPYSIATGARQAGAMALAVTVEPIADGEVSTYLAMDARAGDALEVRGPIGRWFVWKPTVRTPSLLVAGGSGLVPLMSMVRTRDEARRNGVAVPPVRLVVSARTPEALIYATELADLAAADPSLDVRHVWTRSAPVGTARVGRITAADLPDVAPSSGLTSYVCGPTAFVDVAAKLLEDAGLDESRIRTERFG